MDRWQRVLRPRIAIVVASGFVLACADSPTEAPLKHITTFSGHRVIAAISCAADVAAGSLMCERASAAGAETGPQLLIVGGQDVFVTLASSNVSYRLAQERLRADVTLTNLIPQLLGTTDGITPADIRVFFHEGPTVTGGTGTIAVANADGTDTFTGPNQPYFAYLGLLAEDATSEKRVWQFSASPDITFGFSVYVSAAVQYPDGWVGVTPATASLTVGGTQSASAVVYDVVGRAGGTVTWFSDDTNVATVDLDPAYTDGLHAIVTAVGSGTTFIRASTGGPEADGTIEVTVTP